MRQVNGQDLEPGANQIFNPIVFTVQLKSNGRDFRSFANFAPMPTCTGPQVQLNSNIHQANQRESSNTVQRSKAAPFLRANLVGERARIDIDIF